MQSFGISGSGSTRRRSYSTIVVLDEIDMLMTRDQAVRSVGVLAVGLGQRVRGVSGGGGVLS
jgi:hypothetical protein